MTSCQKLGGYHSILTLFFSLAKKQQKWLISETFGPTQNDPSYNSLLSFSDYNHLIPITGNHKTLKYTPFFFLQEYYSTSKHLGLKFN